MFEYTTIQGDKVTLNPNNITVILECGMHCNVYTSDSGYPSVVDSSVWVRTAEIERIELDINDLQAAVDMESGVVL